ncbi:PHP domain-containing protein [Desulfobotulus sp. H1]|uniref:PHP domain-containing protein n=1 Tax=Desulfobotulus pelophilus TaxID=2823377 RepID=A0ABT3NAW5_9BACT|nr:PHP domain-containing protein [Desulfobotulus pelophilus]MCW7754602.1 PHP domain-containing protein [Desulfobotulus pelophilus]
MAFESLDPAVDLHTHSTASDGSRTPQELMEEAVSLGLAALSITDHDTMAGVLEVLDAGFCSAIHFVPGVEISATVPEGMDRQDSLHILGYGMNPHDRQLTSLLERLQEAREKRNPLMIRKLQNLGLDITMEEVAEKSGSGLVGRPHMAGVLVDKGLVPDVDTAFERYLGSGRPAYEEKYRVPWKEAIRVIRTAGGVPVLAHPGLIRGLDRESLRSLLVRLCAEGLSGVEVYYPRHDRVLVSTLEALASEMGLIRTGGSDYHGGLKDGIALGRGFGDLLVPYEVYEELRLAMKKAAGG